jgi:hypothetical protein
MPLPATGRLRIWAVCHLDIAVLDFLFGVVLVTCMVQAAYDVSLVLGASVHC